MEIKGKLIETQKGFYSGKGFISGIFCGPEKVNFFQMNKTAPQVR